MNQHRRLDRIERVFSYLCVAELQCARKGLQKKGLIAFRPWPYSCIDGSYQVLALPRPQPTPRGSGPVALGGRIDTILKR